MRLIKVLACSVLTLILGSAAAPAQIAAGQLRCNVQGGIAYVVTGHRAVTCTYRRIGLPVEFYTGAIDTLGLDIGVSNAAVVTYNVSAAPPEPGLLQGDFAGPGVAIAGGAGVSGKILTGPAGIALVPVPNGETTAVTGFFITAAVNRLRLQYATVDEGYDRRRIHRVLRSYGLSEGTY